MFVLVVPPYLRLVVWFSLVFSFLSSVVAVLVVVDEAQIVSCLLRHVTRLTLALPERRLGVEMCA